MADFNPYQAPRAHVEDMDGNEAIVLAERGARLGAAFIDGLFILMIAWGMWSLFLKGGMSALIAGSKPSYFLSLGVGLSTLSIWIAINFFWLAKHGQTLGKKMLGIKIVRTDHTACSVWRIAGRRFLIPGFMGSIPVIGMIFSLVDPLFIFQASRRCVHDLIADTVVVKA